MKAYMCKKCGLLYGAYKIAKCTCGGDFVLYGIVPYDGLPEVKAELDVFKADLAKEAEP